ncbi:MAG: ABC transporter permease, partial [Candidatus Promineifilaceae bacterium]|nr:ABC transporter permease [Candidatus Promineifilaceae bacterium]
MSLTRIAHVARFEFLSTLRRRSVLIVMFGLPLFTVLLLAVVNFLARTPAAGGASAGAPAPSALSRLVEGEQEPVLTPAGLIDEAGLLGPLAAESAPFFVEYETLEAAQRAYKAGEITSYYLLPAAYAAGEPFIYYGEALDAPGRDVEEWALYQGLVAEQVEDPTLRAALAQPARFELATLTPAVEEDEAPEASNLVLSIAIAMLFYITVIGAAGYLLQSLGKEKQNRIMEILLSSLRPLELLAGKVIGLGAIGVVQLLLWSVILLFVLRGSDGSLFQNIALPSLTILEWLLIVSHFLGGYFLYASLFAGVGAIAPNPKESSQYTFVLMSPVLLPVWFSALIWSAPHGPASAFLSLFPLTSPVAMPMRLTVAAVPASHWVLSLALALLLAMGAIVLAARLFRSQALLSGRPL